MNTLELFSGTQSFTKGIKRLNKNYNTTTVDILPLFKPDIRADILTWDYKKLPTGIFDIIWCSPPCTEYSIAKTTGERKLELADSLVKKCFEILDYFKPRVWILENVGTGLLVKRMENIRPGLRKTFVDYCFYGKPYRKRTVLWSNIQLKLGLCQGKGKCKSMENGKHIGSVGNGSSNYKIRVSSIWDKDAIPDELIDSIIEQALVI